MIFVLMTFYNHQIIKDLISVHFIQNQICQNYFQNITFLNYKILEVLPTYHFIKNQIGQNYPQNTFLNNFQNFLYPISQILKILLNLLLIHHLSFHIKNWLSLFHDHLIHLIFHHLLLDILSIILIFLFL